jgi:hypothetical protein
MSSDDRRVIFWLTIGSLIPVAGWLYGITLLWASNTWSRTQKALGTLAFPCGITGAILAGLTLGYQSIQVCSVGTFGRTDVLGGVPIGGETVVDSGCQSIGALSPLSATLLLLLVLAITIAGPLSLARHARPTDPVVPELASIVHS